MDELDDPGAPEYVMLDFKLADGMDIMLTKGAERSKRIKEKVDLLSGIWWAQRLRGNYFRNTSFSGT